MYYWLHKSIAKSKVTSNSAGAVIKLPCMFTYKTKDASVSKINDGKTAGFSFCLFFFLSSVVKIDKKCANSTQRSQSLNS